MDYKFKYHPDNHIYIGGRVHKSYADFMKNNNGFPLSEGQFLELKTDGRLELLHNIEGTYSHFPQEDLTEFQDLITAINGLK